MSNKKITRKMKETSKVTTIKLVEETKIRLEKLREHKGESYNDILKKILYILNVARDDPEKAKRVLERISDLRIRMLEEEQQRNENLLKEQAQED